MGSPTFTEWGGLPTFTECFFLPTSTEWGGGVYPHLLSGGGGYPHLLSGGGGGAGGFTHLY